MENHREIIDYLYERAAKLVAGSGSPIPRTLSPIISRLDSASNMESLSITLPKDEFLRYIGALIQFEKYSKPAGELTHQKQGVSLARENLNSKLNATAGRRRRNVREKPSYMKVCINNPRLFELYDFLQDIPDEFRAGLLFKFVKHSHFERSGEFSHSLRFEFSVYLYGVWLNAELSHYEVEDVELVWREKCVERGYENDFSRLIVNGWVDTRTNVVVFALDGMNTYRA
jgi:hypothetical protein